MHHKLLRQYEACPESKHISLVGRYENFYAYCGNTAVDLDPLPVNRARLTVVEPALSETCSKWQRRSEVAPNVRCVSPYGFSTQKMNVGYTAPSAVQSGPRAPRFHLFFHLKKHLDGKKLDDDDEVQEEVVMWFKGQAADFYVSGIQKLVPRLNKCLDNAGDYVEK
jgi:hypothetical protein